MLDDGSDETLTEDRFLGKQVGWSVMPWHQKAGRRNSLQILPQDPSSAREKWCFYWQWISKGLRVNAVCINGGVMSHGYSNCIFFLKREEKKKRTMFCVLITKGWFIVFRLMRLISYLHIRKYRRIQCKPILNAQQIKAISLPDCYG